jgi:Protein of unknown function (DUF1573).
MLGGVAFAQSKPAAQFTRTEHNFGSVRESLGAVTTEFEFTNIGDAPLIIQRVAASCGCTTPGYSREPILPGKKGKIHCSLFYYGASGKFQ